MAYDKWDVSPHKMARFQDRRFSRWPIPRLPAPSQAVFCVLKGYLRPHFSILCLY